MSGGFYFGKAAAIILVFLTIILPGFIVGAGVGFVASKLLNLPHMIVGALIIISNLATVEILYKKYRK